MNLCFFISVFFLPATAKLEGDAFFLQIRQNHESCTYVRIDMYGYVASYEARFGGTDRPR